MQMERRERYSVRKRYLEETLGEDPLELPARGLEEENITRGSLEEEARQASLSGSAAEELFWKRQRGWEEVVQVGEGLIERMAPGEGKKER